MWIFLGREKPTLFNIAHLFLSHCLLSGFCLQYSTENAVLKSANHFQVVKSKNHFPVLTLFDFSEEFHEVDPLSLKQLIPSHSLFFSQLIGYSSVTFAGFSTLVDL